MTEEKKQEPRQLLDEAIADTEIRDEYDGEKLPLPVDVYRRYLAESWKYFGLARFSPFWIRPTVSIVNPDTKSHLLDFIRDALALFIDGHEILTARYLIESNSTDSPCVRRFQNKNKGVHPRFILKRLLDIALVRGKEQAVSVFDRCSRPEGAQGVFQDVSVVKGITLNTDIDVFKGVRLVPLLDSGISDEFISYFRFPVFAFRYENPNFFGQTLLVIDRPGFSIFHKPGPNQVFPQGLPVGELPFQVREHDTKFRDLGEVDSFQESFSQALSLALNSPIQIPRAPFRFDKVQIPRGGYFFEEDRTFNPRDISMTSLIPANLIKVSVTADETHVELARYHYKRLVDFNAKDRRKLLIAIDRWIKSKSSGSEVDSIIDVGIALEALYVTEDRRIRELLSKHASLYLEDVSPQKTLQDEFKAIYKLRSDIVHSNVVREKVAVGDQCVPIPDLVARAQDLCQKSIVKIIKEGTIPDWNSLRQRTKQDD